MSDLETIHLPDIGDFESVEVIEVLVEGVALRRLMYNWYLVLFHSGSLSKFEVRVCEFAQATSAYSVTPRKLSMKPQFVA